MISLKIKKKTRRIIYVGLIAYVVFLLVSLPASFLTRYVLPAVDKSNSMSLQSVRGTLWNGHANNTRVAMFDLGTLKWNLSAWSILLGDVALDVNFKSEQAKGSGDVAVGFGGTVAAENIELQFPAEMLLPLIRRLPISISGGVRGTVNQLNYEQFETLQVDGRFVWQDAAMRAPQNFSFGDIMIEMTPHNRGTKIKITDQNKGPVKMELNIRLEGSTKYTLNGWLQPKDPSQQHITEALRFVGAKGDSTGRYWLTANGTLAQKHVPGQRKVR